jgi:LPS sulfotransferase NodH
MKNNLVIYTPRTGSTFLTEILAASTGTVNLNESIVDSCVSAFNRQEVFSNPYYAAYRPSLQALINKEFSEGGTRSFKPYADAKQLRINLLKQTSMWTVKETSSPFQNNFEFVKYCCNSDDVNVYMVYRKDIVSQFISFIHMVNNKSIFTQSDIGNSELKPGNITDRTIAAKTPVFVDMLVYWRLLYEMFKDKVTLVNYEDVIKTMDFSSLGIDKDVVEKYNMRDNHIVPTPYKYGDMNSPTWHAAINTIESVKWVTNTL